MSLKVEALEMPDVKLVTPSRFGDQRGYFSETYNAQQFIAAGIDAVFVQDNQSYSALAGTVRGLHYQAPPFAQSKLVRVLRGAILDVAVDVRAGSLTFGKWVKAEISAENGIQIFVPKGFLHGFATLVPDTEVLYKVDAPYSKDHDGGVLWNDIALGIEWGISPVDAIVSEKDRTANAFSEFVSPF